MALSRTFAVGEILTAEDVNTHLVNHVPTPGDEYDTGWLLISLASGVSAGNRPPRARRVGMRVEVRGYFNADGITAGVDTEVGTLPAGMAPPENLAFASAGASVAFQRLRIFDSGKMFLCPEETGSWYAIDGVTWTVG